MIINHKKCDGLCGPNICTEWKSIAEKQKKTSSNHKCIISIIRWHRISNIKEPNVRETKAKLCVCLWKRLGYIKTAFCSFHKCRAKVLLRDDGKFLVDEGELTNVILVEIQLWRKQYIRPKMDFADSFFWRFEPVFFIQED